MSDKQPHGPVVNQNRPKLKIDNKQTDVDSEDEGLAVPEGEYAKKPCDDVADEHGRIKLPKQ